MSYKPPSRERPVYTLRLAQSERATIEAAARARKEYLAEFIRRSALEAAENQMAEAEMAR